MRRERSVLTTLTRGRIVWRVVLAFAMIVPGFLLTFFTGEWSQGTISPTFHQLEQLHIPIQLIGLVLLISGLIALFFERWRDIAYGIAAGYYAIALFGALTATVGGDLRSVLLFVLPVAIIAYIDAALETARHRELSKVIPPSEADSDAE